MKNIIIKLHDAKQTVQQIQLTTQNGKPLVLKAQGELNYEFLEQGIGHAPNHIITKRIGKDLHVSFEEEGKESDLIIEEFYANENHALIGLAENNQYYYYIPDTGEVADYVTQLQAGNVEGQALGGEHLLAPWWISTPAATATFPWWLGLGILPIAALGGNSKNNNPDNTPQDSSKVNNNSAFGEAGKPVTQHVTADDLNVKPETTKLIDPITHQPVTSITVPGQGVWTIKPGTDEVTFTPEPGYTGSPTPIKYVVTDNQGNPVQGEVSVVYPPVDNNPSTNPPTPETPTSEPSNPSNPSNPNPPPATNQSPTAVDDSYSVVSGNSISLKPLDKDTDPEQDPLTVTAINGTAITAGTAQDISVPNGTVHSDGNGNFTFTPTTGYTGTTQFSYTIDDGHGHTASANEIIAVTPATNQAPTAVDDSYSVVSGNSISLKPLDKDTDPEQDPLTVTAINGTAITAGTAQDISVPNGTVHSDGNGNFTFTPTTGYTGTTQFSYTIDDGHGHTASANEIIAVTPATNQAPTAVDDSYSVVSGNSISLKPLDKDTDPEQDPLTVTAINGTAITAGTAQDISVPNGTVHSDGNGNFTFTPTTGYTGTTQFSYTIDDGHGHTASANEIIAVTPATNQAPTAVDDSYSVVSGNSISLKPLDKDTDPEQDPLTVTAINGTAITAGTAQDISVPNGTVHSDGNGNFTFTPTTGYTGTTQFSYTIDDGHGHTASANEIIAVTPATNQAPTAVDDSYSVVSGNSISLKPLDKDTDPEQDPLTVTAINGTAITAGTAQDISVPNGTVHSDGNGNFTFTPTTGYTGTTQFSYTIDDGHGHTASANEIIAVTPATNQAPTAVDDSYSVVSGNSISLKPLDKDTDPEQDPLTVTAINGTAITAGTAQDISVPNGTVHSDGNGNFTFTPTTGYTGTTQFSYTIDDGHGHTASANEIIAVTPATNQAPTAVDDSYSVVSGNSISLKPLDKDTDPEQDPLTVTAINGTAITAGTAQDISVPNGTVHSDGNGNFTFTPTTGYTGTTQFSYTIDDGHGHTASANEIIAVTPATNQAPTAVDDSYSVVSGNSISLKPLDKDTDPEQDPLTVTAINGTAITAGTAQDISVPNGTVHSDGNGNFTFTPTTGYTGTTQFSYTIDDGHGHTASANEIIAVTPATNQAPTAVDDSYSVVSGNSISLKPLDKDTDPEQDPLTVTAINGTAITAGTAQDISVPNGTVHSDGNGNFTFTPTTGYTGTTQFSYTIDDGHGHTASANEIIAVTPATNQAPTAVDDSYSVVSGNSISLKPLDKDTDPEQDPLTVTAINGTAITAGTAQDISVPNGTVHSDGNGNFTFTPTTGYTGTTQFSYTIDDGHGHTASANEIIAVTPATNQAPTAVDDSYSVVSGNSISLKPLDKDTDPEQDPLTVTAINGTAITAGTAQDISVPNGTVHSDGNGNFTFTPTTGYTGTTQFSYTIDDGHGHTASANEIIAVTPATNQAPTAVDDSYSVVSGNSISLKPLDKDTDPEQDPLTVTAINGTAITAGTAQDISVPNGTVHSDGNGNFTFTPTTGYTGTTQFSYTIDDGHGHTASANEIIAVTPATNQAPTAVDDSYSVVSGNSISLKPLDKDTDPEQDPLTVTAINGTAITAGTAQDISVPNGTVHSDGNGNFTFTPTTGYTGTTQFSYTIDDGHGHTASANEIIAVTPATNQAPTAVDDSYSVVSGNSISLKPLDKDTDPEQDPLTVTAINGTAITAGTAQDISVPNGTVHSDGNGNFTFTPTTGYTGTTQFSYTIDDGHGHTASANEIIAVTPATNQAPTAVDDSYSVVSGNSISLKPLDKDTDPEQDPLTVTAINGTAITAGTAQDISVPNGTVHSDGNGNFTFTPTTGYTGTTQFSYTIDDGHGHTASANEIIAVTPATNQAPTAVDDSYSVVSGNSISLKPLDKDTDPEQDPLTVTAINGTAITAGTAQDISVPNGTVHSDGNGNFTFTPTTGYTGTTQFSYTIDDGHGHTASANEIIAVTPATNQAPTAVDDSYSVVSGNSISLKPLDKDTDPEQDPLTVTAINGTAITAGTAQDISVPNGTVHSDGNGNFTFTPTTGYTGTTQFSYTIDDGHGHTASANEIIAVTPATNQAPTAVDDSYSVVSGNSISLKPLDKDTDPEQDPLTVTAINGTAITAGTAQDISVPNGTVHSDGNGNFTFTPTTGYTGTTQFSYTIDDGHGHTASANEIIAVTPATNQAPTAVDDSYSVVSGNSISLKPLDKDTDPEQDPLTVTAINGTAITAGTAQDISVPNGTVHSDGNGNFTFTPTTGYTGTTQFSYTIDDGHGHTASANEIIAVTPATNQAPTAVDDSYSVVSGNSISLKPLDKDTDPEQDPLTVTAINGTAITAGTAQDISVPNGTVHSDGNGNFTFTPTTGYTGTTQFSYTIDDGHGHTASANEIIAVTPATNQAPTAVDDSYSVVSGNSISLKPLDKDTDPEQDPLTVTAINGTAITAGTAQDISVPNGTVHSDGNGNFTFTPTTGYTGTTQFSYTIDDGHGHTASANEIIAVTPATNQAPTAVDDSYSVVSGNSISLKPLDKDTDPEQDPLTVTAINGTAITAGTAQDISVPNGTVHSDGNGNFTFTPTTGYTGTTQFSYTIDDGHGHTASANEIIAVTPATNQAPTAVDDSYSVVSGNSISLKPLDKDTDPEQDPLTVTAINGTAITAGTAQDISVPNGTVHSDGNGNFTFTRTTGYTGTTQFSYTIDDGHGHTASANEIIAVTPATNQAPTAVDDSYSVVSGNSISLKPLDKDTDPEQDPLTVTAINGTAITAGTAQDISVPNGTVHSDGNGNFTFTPTTGYTGTTQFSYTIDDGHGHTASANEIIAVTPATNQAPTAVDDSYSVVSGNSISLKPLDKDTDPEQDPLTVTAINGTAITAGTAQDISVPNGTVHSDGNGNFTFTPTTGYTGTTQFSYTIDDGHGHTASANEIIAVTPATNQAPTAVDDSYSVVSGNSISLKPLDKDTDPEQDPLTVTAINGTAITAGTAQDISVPNGTVHSDGNGNFTFTPTTGYTGTTQFSYTIDDGHGHTASANEIIAVTPATNQAPTAVDDSYSVVSGNSISLKPLDKDTDPEQDPLTVTAINGTAITAGTAQDISVPNGTVHSDGNGNFTFTPTTGYTGTTQFSYTIDDGHGHTASANEIIAVTPATNQAPTAVDDSYSVVSGNSISLKPLDKDTDPEQDPLTVTAINGTAITAGTAQDISVPNGTVHSDGNGNFTFTPTTGYTGTTQFSYTIDDGHGHTASANEIIAVTPATNQAPTAVDDSYSVVSGNSISLKPLDKDTDPEQDPLTVTAINGTAITAGTAQDISVPNGTVHSDGNGNFTFTPTTGYTGTTQFSYTIDDGHGHTASANEIIAVTPATNQAPTAVDDSYSVVSGNSISLKPLDKDTDPEQDPLTVTAINGTAITAGTAQDISVPNGTVHSDGNGNFTFTPTTGYTGTTQFSYTIDDGHGHTASANEIIAVTPATNQAPTAVDDSYSVVSGNSISLKPLDKDTDPEQDPLTVTAINGTAITAGTAQDISVPNGTVHSDGNGNFTFTPTTGYTGTTQFSYTIDDGHGHTASANEIIAVTPATNQAPTAVDDSYSVVSGNSISLKPLDKDTDPEQDPLTVTAINGTAITAGTAQDISVPNGTVHSDGNGNFTFTPTTGYTGTTQFSYTIDDGHGHTASANEIIAVTPATNQAPTAVDDSYSVVSGNSISLKPLDKDTDPEQDPLTVTAINGTAITAGTAQDISVPNGTVHSDGNGNFTFTPTTGYTGTTQFSYTIDDGHGHTASANEIIAVTPATNQAPTAVDDSYSVVSGNSISLKPLDKDTDPEQDPLTVTAINGTAITAGTAQDISVPNGTVHSDGNGNFTFTPTTGYTGTTQFSYTIDDGHGHTASANEIIVVTPATNQSPIATNNSYTTLEDVAISGNVMTDNTGNGVDSDPDSQPIIVTSFSVDITGNGTLTSFTAGQTATINGIGTLVINTDGTYTFTPAANYNGPVPTATYTITDGALTATATLAITITPVNDVPVAISDTYTIDQDTTKVLLPLVNDYDVDGDTLKITSINGVDLTPGTAQVISVPNGTVNIDTAGKITFTPTAGFVGESHFNYTISDGNGGVAGATQDIYIKAVNHQPVAVSDSYTMLPTATLTLNPLQGDYDSDVGDTVTLTHINNVLLTPGIAQDIPVTGGVVHVDTAGVITFTLTPGATSPIFFPYTITDSHGLTAGATQTIYIAPTTTADTAIAMEAGGVNNGTAGIDPKGNVLDNDTASADANHTKLVTLAGTGASGGLMAVTLAGTDIVGQYGTLHIAADGSYQYFVNNDNPTVQALPDATATLSETFNYTMADSANRSSSTTLTITIQGQNDAPVAVNDTNSIAKVDNPVGIATSIYVADRMPRSTVGILDTTTGKVTSLGTVTTGGNADTADMAVMPDGKFYFLHSTIGGSSSSLYSYNNNNLTSTPVIKPITTPLGGNIPSMSALGTDGAGNLYGATERGKANSSLYKIDPSTGNATFLIKLTDGASGDIAYFDNALYITQDDSTIQKYDLITGKLTKFMDTPNAGFYGIAFDNAGTMWLSDASATTNTGKDYLYKVDMLAVPPQVQPIKVTTISGTASDIYGMASTTPSVNLPLNMPKVTGDVTPATPNQDYDIDTGNTFSVTNVSFGGTNAAVTGTAAGHINGLYGWLDINADGTYTYTLDQTRAATHNLTAAAEEIFTYTITDQSGLSSQATLDISVQGKTTSLGNTIWDDVYSVTTNNFANYDAGLGNDTLKLNNAFGDLTLDFSTMNLGTANAKLNSIENIDMNNTAGTQKLLISASDVLALNSHGVVHVKLGGNNDTVDLQEAIGTGASSWHKDANVSGTNALYIFYDANNKATDTKIFIDNYNTGSVI